jgi:hypothetical protein
MLLYQELSHIDARKQYGGSKHSTWLTSTQPGRAESKHQVNSQESFFSDSPAKARTINEKDKEGQNA